MNIENNTSSTFLIHKTPLWNFKNLYLGLSNAFKNSNKQKEKNAETKKLYGFTLNDLDSISDYIIKHKNPFNLNEITEIIKELSIFENEKDLKIYMTKLEKAIRNKLGGE